MGHGSARYLPLKAVYPAGNSYEFVVSSDPRDDRVTHGTG